MEEGNTDSSGRVLFKRYLETFQMPPEHPPRWPLLSSMTLFSMSCICCCFSFLPVPLQAVLSSLMIGGLFGLMIPPCILLHASIYGIKHNFELPGYGTIYGALFIIYVVMIVILDPTPKRPLPNLTMRQPTNFIERRSLSFWKTHFSYFPFSIIKQNPGLTFDKSKQYVFAVHPHGIHCWALNALAFPGSAFDEEFDLIKEGRMTGLAASVIFMIPVVRELFLSMGYVDASRHVADKVLRNGRSLFVCTGGEEESMRTVVGQDLVVLKKRKGFVRLAVSHGASLVPVFGIGISDLYSTYDLGTLGFRMWLQKKTGIALPIFHGKWLSPLPYKRPLRVLVGEPIPIKPEHQPKTKGARPDNEIVEIYHKKYIEALKDLHKQEGEGRKLEIL